ncbi:MAG: hypothetical protein WCI51_12995 [Lentisphaerota bacterium]
MATGTAFRLMKVAGCGALLFTFGIQVQSQEKSKAAKQASPPELTSSHKEKGPITETTLAMKGNTLTAQEAAELEQKLSLNPENIIIITKLLGYWSGPLFYDDGEIKQKREKYILWLIKNHPEAEVLGMRDAQLNVGFENYSEAKSLWLEQLEKHPDNLKIVGNAANSLVSYDTDLAIKYYKKAKSLDQQNYRWDFLLGFAYNLKCTSPVHSGNSQDPEAAKESLNYYEKAYFTTEGKKNNLLLESMAKAALMADDLSKAEEYANKMLVAKDYYYTYYGNFILGLIAIKKGNIDVAGNYLLESTNFSGKVEFNIILDMTLAQEFLTRGKREIVLEFLKRISKFWKYNGTCEQWVKEMEDGGTPDLSLYALIGRRYMAKPESK